MTGNTQPAEPPVSRPGRLPLVSLILGLLSVWPYLLWLVAVPLTRSQQLPSIVNLLLGGILLFIVPCNGLVFGLAGLGIGVISARRKMSWMALAGILLGLLGCAGNLWYFTLL
jgi:hypothetical protein